MSSTTAEYPGVAIARPKAQWLQMLLVVLAQLLMAGSKFMDFRAVSSLGGTEFEFASLVLSQVIIAVALVGGALQTLLIFGSPAHVLGDHELYAKYLRVAWRLTVYLSIAATLSLLAIGAFIAFGPNAAGPRLMGVYLSVLPAFGILCIIELLTMNFIVRGRLLALVLAVLAMLLAKIAIYPIVFHGAPRLGSGFEWGLLQGSVLSSCLAAGLLLVFSMAKREAIFGKSGLDSETKREFNVVGLQIGLVVVVEVATFSLAQLMLWLIDPARGALFAAALQIFVLMETLAIALGRLLTSQIAAAQHVDTPKDLNIKTLKGLAWGISIPILMMAVMLQWPDWVLRLLVPESDALGASTSIQLLHDYIRLSGIAQLLACAVILLAAALRGLGDVSSPMLLIGLNYAVLGLGVSAVALYGLHWIDYGAWTGVLIALFMSVLVLGFRLLKLTSGRSQSVNLS